MLKHELHTPKPSSFTVKAVKIVMVKNCPCKSLILNGVKPGQGKSNQLGRGVKVVGQAAKFAGLGSGNSWHPMWQYLNLGARYCQLLSDKFTYGYVWSHILVTYWGNNFSNCTRLDASWHCTATAGQRVRIPSPHDAGVGRGLGRGVAISMGFHRYLRSFHKHPSPRPSPHSFLMGRGR